MIINNLHKTLSIKKSKKTVKYSIWNIIDPRPNLICPYLNLAFAVRFQSSTNQIMPSDSTLWKITFIVSTSNHCLNFLNDISNFYYEAICFLSWRDGDNLPQQKFPVEWSFDLISSFVVTVGFIRIYPS